MPKSKSEDNRLQGKYQSEEQRAAILDAAERLFLRIGLQSTRMTDIAAEAGITKVTLYRYFPNRDTIALEIQVRMLNRVAALVDEGEDDISLEGARAIASAMIRNFDRLRDAFRFIGMFDQVYLDHPVDAPLAQWTKSRLLASAWRRGKAFEMGRSDPIANECAVILSAVVWFLEKLALRGELTWSDQAVPLEAHLKVFEDMILGYFDRLTEAQHAPKLEENHKRWDH